MEDFISAIETNDLVKAKKISHAFLDEAVANLIEARKVEIARSIMIEGEEEEEDEDDSDKDDSKDSKDKDDDEEDEDEE